jgi:hypothetical protein
MRWKRFSKCRTETTSDLAAKKREPDVNWPHA